MTTRNKNPNQVIMIKSALILLAVCFICFATAESVWCNKKGAECLLPGVGPTYDCGKKVGWDSYRSEADKRYWDVGGLTSTQFNKFKSCCSASGKGSCHGN
ncbi:hypothetical protein BCR43DRAFT_510480 [Syncephalastrum racemosum]|uniref:Uncharacterized protein n=1 Tax=Syncephalastrum racemosum TaxID=13706 RepID=A0A1X2HVB1_SYNRA|nr:hypothetical protein BCR43DRAFT_510480 [Syncephalastrum racemosum]